LFTQIIYENPDELSSIETLICTPALAIAFSKQHREYEALKLAEILMKHGLYNVSAILVTALLNGDRVDDYKKQEYRNILAMVLDNAADKTDKARYLYNIGNSLGSSHIYHQSIICYIKAAKLDKSYLERSYWWSEIAGKLFLLKKYKWSETCYKISLKKRGVHPHIRALLSDTLFYQGRYKEACKEIEKYLKTCKTPICEYILKESVFSFIHAHFKDGDRDTTTAITYINKAISTNDSGQANILFNKAVEADPTYGLCWYNIAVANKSEVDNWYLWLVTCVLQNSDVESWKNLALSIMSIPPERITNVMCLSMYEAMRLNKMDLTKQLKEDLLCNQGLAIKDIEQVLNIFEENYQRQNALFPEKDSFTYRYV
jgi:tetratricopeptide (TPR) repeat protein